MIYYCISINININRCNRVVGEGVCLSILCMCLDGFVLPERDRLVPWSWWRYAYSTSFIYYALYIIYHMYYLVLMCLLCLSAPVYRFVAVQHDIRIAPISYEQYSR